MRMRFHFSGLSARQRRCRTRDFFASSDILKAPPGYTRAHRQMRFNDGETNRNSLPQLGGGSVLTQAEAQRWQKDQILIACLWRIPADRQ